MPNRTGCMQNNILTSRLRFSVDGRLSAERRVSCWVRCCAPLPVLANAWALFFSRYMRGFVGRLHSYGPSRPRCHEWSSLSGVHPDRCGSLDPLLEAVLRTAEVAGSVPLVLLVARLPRPLQIVRVVHIIFALLP